MSSRQPASIEMALTETVALVEKALDDLLPRPAGLHGRVQEAMRYAVFAGGKRLRPFLTIASARLFGLPASAALRTAAAIEMLHTYSLVHDDLPCMDDDDLRRGQPTTHVKFDEATAVLAGDALLTLAFEILADPATHASAEVRCTLSGMLARAAGSNGMIGGQMIDLAAAHNTFGPEETILLQRLKTGALFEFSCQAGPVLAEAGTTDRERLRTYAQNLGLAFQIVDDLIDATGSSEKAGKTVGKDRDQGKATLVSHYGIEGARREARACAERAAAAIEAYGEAAGSLRALAFYLLDRDA